MPNRLFVIRDGLIAVTLGVVDSSEPRERDIILRVELCGFLKEWDRGWIVLIACGLDPFRS